MSALRVPWSQRPKTEKVAKAGFIDPKLRRAVYERAGGNCECCGERLQQSAFQCHHRKLRARGGQDSITNLLALCAMCHRRLHSHVRFATDHGFLVSTYDDPAFVPLFLHLDRHVLLTSQGGYRASEAA